MARPRLARWSGLALGLGLGLGLGLRLGLGLGGAAPPCEKVRLRVGLGYGLGLGLGLRLGLGLGGHALREARPRGTHVRLQAAVTHEQADAAVAACRNDGPPGLGLGLGSAGLG